MVPIQLGSLFRTGIDSRLIGDGEHTITTKEDMRTHRFSIFDPPSRAGSSYRTWERGERVLHAASFYTVCNYMIDLQYGAGGTYIWYSPNPILRSYLDLHVAYMHSCEPCDLTHLVQGLWLVHVKGGSVSGVCKGYITKVVWRAILALMGAWGPHKGPYGGLGPP